MPNHVHLLIYPQLKPYSISQILHHIKQPVARQAIAWLKQHNPNGLKLLETGQKTQPYRFWQKGGGYDRNIINVETLIDAVQYIHQNPVRKGLAPAAVQWFYSSAACWENPTNGPIPIDRHDWPAFLK